MTIVDFESPTLNEKGEVIARTQYKAEQFTEDLGDGIQLDMIVIPAGAFYMGSLPQEISKNNPDTSSRSNHLCWESSWSHRNNGKQ